jgi:hypothetical protein
VFLRLLASMTLDVDIARAVQISTISVLTRVVSYRPRRLSAVQIVNEVFDELLYNRREEVALNGIDSPRRLSREQVDPNDTTGRLCAFQSNLQGGERGLRVEHVCTLYNDGGGRRTCLRPAAWCIALNNGC